MQAHTKYMNEKEQLFPKQHDLWNFKSVDLPIFDQECHAMSVTCIVKLIILQTKNNIFHISYHVVHIILSYAMRPWDHGHDVRTSLNEGTTYGSSTRENFFSKHRFCFIHLYVLHYSFFHILVQSPVIPTMQFKTLIEFAMQ